MKTKTLLLTVAIFTIVLKMTAQENGTFTDSRDGKVYKTVKIKTQTWMAENLAYNTPIGCWAYDDNESNVATYGYLYTWEVAKLSCPAGWHLPTMEEYETLLTNVGGSGKTAYKALIKGGKSGFSVLFGGYLKNDGEYKGFFFMNRSAYFWCSTASSDTNDTWSFYLDLGTFDKKEANIYYSYRGGGLSVRCIKD